MRPVALPEPGVAVERGEVVPDAGGVPARAVDHAFALGGFQHGQGARDQRIVLGENLPRIDGVAEGPLGRAAAARCPALAMKMGT